MTCEHLQQLEEEMIAAGVPITFRGQAWSDNCREWVYFNCYLDRVAIRNRMALSPCVLDHDHLGTHDGQEAGFRCSECKDGIMGIHKHYLRPSTRVYK